VARLQQSGAIVAPLWFFVSETGLVGP